MANLSKGYKELLKLAKAKNVKTIEELEEIVYDCKEEISGGDFESVKTTLKIKRF